MNASFLLRHRYPFLSETVSGWAYLLVVHNNCRDAGAFLGVGCYPNHPSGQGDGFLYRAAINGYRSMVMLLLDHGGRQSWCQ